MPGQERGEPGGLSSANLETDTNTVELQAGCSTPAWWHMPEPIRRMMKEG